MSVEGEFSGSVICAVGMGAIGSAIALDLCGDLVAEIVDFAEDLCVAPTLGKAESSVIDRSARGSVEDACGLHTKGRTHDSIELAVGDGGALVGAFSQSR